jgi:hypothetical protein
LMIEQNSEFISWFDDKTKFRIYNLVFSLMSLLCSCGPSFFIIIHQSEIQLDWVLPTEDTLSRAGVSNSNWVEGRIDGSLIVCGPHKA